MAYGQHPQKQHDREEDGIYFQAVFVGVEERRRDEHQNERAQKLRDRSAIIADAHGMIARQHARDFFHGG